MASITSKAAGTAGVVIVTTQDDAGTEIYPLTIDEAIAAVASMESAISEARERVKENVAARS